MVSLKTRRPATKYSKMSNGEINDHLEECALLYMAKHRLEFGPDCGIIHKINYKERSVPRNAVFAMWADGPWLEDLRNNDELEYAVGKMDCELNLDYGLAYAVRY